MITAVSGNNSGYKDDNYRNHILGKKEKEGSNYKSGKKAHNKENVIKPNAGTGVFFDHFLPVHNLIIQPNAINIKGKQ